MAESNNISLSIIDCPATPERIDQCPSTPGPVLRIKSPHSTSSAASSDNEFSLRQRSANSPPPNCAICLGKCKNKCFTDSCLHQFCFKCLLEWSKVKAECPLCKQSFTSIIHNVKSIDQFEEYLVRPSQPELPIQAHLITPPAFLLRSDLLSNNLDLFVDAPRQTTNVYSTNGISTNGNGISTNAYSTTVEVHANPFIHRSELINRFRQRFPDVPPGSLGQLWRRYVYERRLHALPVVDSVTGRFRECSARFYRENPAQIHRLMPWLNRDIVTLLLRENDQHVSYVLSVINDLLSIYNINSPEFRQRVTPYFRENTSHFIHELINFARSPFDMIGYDREVRYTTFFEEIVLSTASSSSSSDSDDVVAFMSDAIIARRLRGNAVDFTIETNRDSSVRITLGENDNTTTSTILTPTSNNASTSQITAINLTTNNNSSSSASNVQILGQTPVIQIERCNVLLSSSSSSDECQFVLEQKPPHLRTPEMVSLNSESDSDVVFVSELKSEPPVVNQQQQNLNPLGARRKRVFKKTLPKGVFLQSSEVGQSSDSDNELQVKIEKRTTAKKSNTTATATATATTKKSNAEKDKDTQDEYNYGASTSSGLKASSQTKLDTTKKPSRVCEKYYAKPNLRKRKCTKSIYEDSSSSISSSRSSSSSSDESSSSTSTCSSSSNLFLSSSSSDFEFERSKKNCSLSNKSKMKHINRKTKHQCPDKKSRKKNSTKKVHKRNENPKKSNKITQRYKKTESKNEVSSESSLFSDLDKTNNNIKHDFKETEPKNDVTSESQPFNDPGKTSNNIKQLFKETGPKTDVSSESSLFSFSDSDSEPLSKQLLCRNPELKLQRVNLEQNSLGTKEPVASEKLDSSNRESSNRQSNTNKSNQQQENSDGNSGN